MEKSIKVIGRIIRCRVKEFSSGLMDEFTRVIIIMTRNMVLVEYGGQMEESMKDSGREEFSMVKANTKVVMEHGNKVVGNSASV